MKSIKIVLSLLFVFALVLSACGTAEETTTVPTVGATDVLPGTGATAPAATLVPTPTKAATATTAVTAVPTTSGGSVITGTAVMTDTIGFDPHRLSNWLGANAQTPNGDDIGEIGDVVLNLETEMADYVVLQSGGFLGIGEKEILIPWSMVEGGDTPNMTSTIAIDVTEEQLDAAPDVDFDDIDLRYDVDWDEEIDTFWVNGGIAITGTATMTAPVVTAEVLPTMAATGTVTGSMDLQGSILASTLLGYDVQSENDDDYGDVEDAVIDPQTGEVMYVLVSADGSLGLDDDSWFAIPLSALRLAGDDDDMIILDVEPDFLSGAPTFTIDTWPDFDVSGWDDEIRSYWNKITQ